MEEERSRRCFLQACVALTVTGVASAVSVASACRNNDGESGPDDRPSAAVDANCEPSYLSLHRSGELKRRGEKLWKTMHSCELCPRQCGTDRLSGDHGMCGASSELVIAAHHPHFGEERSLVGRGGSGTVFFTHCGLRCVFCINWEVSQGGLGSAQSVEQLAEMMLRLQRIGCHNINVVTPTHFSAHIVQALDVAAGRGLRLPLVYNTCGWERPEILRLLDGVVDIYLPDFKYSEGEMAAKYSSGASSYPELTRQALVEMHRQVGVARPAEDGLMYRGLIIRHLVMPNDVGGSKRIFEWIAANLSPDTYVNVMSQYSPVFKARDYPSIARRITKEEYRQAVGWARDAGLTNLDLQGSPR